MKRESRHPITLKPVLYHVDGMEAVAVPPGVQYGSYGGRPLVLDLYQPVPPQPAAPVVVIVTGYPDVGVSRPLGCAFKDMTLWTTLGRLLAASGIAAVGYTSARPAHDIDVLLDYLAEHMASLGIDAGRLGLWATSGHVPTALGALARRGGRSIRAAVLSTGFTLDLVGSAVSDAARQYGFALSGTSFEALPADLPVLMARAGREENHGLNDAMDRFVAAAFAANWPLTVVNHASVGHAFELNDDSVTTKYVIGHMIAFTKFWLSERHA